MKKKTILQEFWQVKILYLIILPAALYFIILSFFPVLDGFKMSFQDYRLVGKSAFVGLENYQKMFNTPGFWRVFGNTVILGMSNVFLTALVPMLIALSLNEISFSPGKRFTQSILYLPHLFSWVVVGGIWIFILSPNAGLLNAIRNIFGLDSVYFLAKEKYARIILITVNLWKQSGYVCIIYLAAIVGINPQLYEAAMIDGANGWQRTLYITIPELMRTLKIVFLLNLMGALRIFDQVYVMRNEVTAPKVDVLMYYVYIHGLEKFKIGYASAIATFIFIITLVVTLVVKRGTRYRA